MIGKTRVGFKYLFWGLVVGVFGLAGPPIGGLITWAITWAATLATKGAPALHSPLPLLPHATTDASLRRATLWSQPHAIST